MIGKIFITRTGYDPELGKHVKDPYLGDSASLGACRPDIRRLLEEGDHIFVISGKVQNAKQFVMGGFQIERKMTALEAYQLFPEQRLRMRDDGQLTGNIIVNADGTQHQLDGHRPKTFPARAVNYVVGKNQIALISPTEIALGREQTLEALQHILKRKGSSALEVVGRWGAGLTEEQVIALREWLLSLKKH